MRKQETLEERSKKFHALEWLRSEAIKGNRHAVVMLKEVIDLNLTVGLHEAIADRNATDEWKKKQLPPE